LGRTSVACRVRESSALRVSEVVSRLMDFRSVFSFCTSPDAVRNSLCEDYDKLPLELPTWSCSTESVCLQAATGCMQDVVVGKGLRPTDLANAMTAAACSVQPWIPGSFGVIKKLQDACGNFGHVDLMQSALHNKKVAVKQMPNKWVSSSAQEFEAQNPGAAERPWIDFGLLWELNRIHFPYTTELLGIFRDEERTYVVTSLATEGDLFSWKANDLRPGPQREAMMVPIMGQVFAAVKWLHDLGIAHRDLSLENILLTEGGQDEAPKVKIIDFAMSTLASAVRSEARGKVVYRAPEMYEKEAYDPFLVDAFALGVVLFAVAARDYPWSCTKRGMCKSFDFVLSKGFRAFLRQRRLRNSEDGTCLSEVLSPSFAELLEGLLELSPSRRWALGEARLDLPDKARASALESRWLAEAAAVTTTAAAEAADISADADAAVVPQEVLRNTMPSRYASP